MSINKMYDFDEFIIYILKNRYNIENIKVDKNKVTIIYVTETSNSTITIKRKDYERVMRGIKIKKLLKIIKKC